MVNVILLKSCRGISNGVTKLMIKFEFTAILL